FPLRTNTLHFPRMNTPHTSKQKLVRYILVAFLPITSSLAVVSDNPGGIPQALFIPESNGPTFKLGSWQQGASGAQNWAGMSGLVTSGIPFSYTTYSPMIMQYWGGQLP